MIQLTERPLQINRLVIILIIIIVSSILMSGCKEQKTKVYLYSAFTKVTSINNTYHEHGYPNPDAGNWCKWGPMDTDKSIILIDQSKDLVKIFNQNIIEEYKITKTYSQDDYSKAFSFAVLAKNNKGKECMIAIGDLNFFIVIRIMIPYEPARMYMVTSIDSEELMRKLKARFDRVPR